MRTLASELFEHKRIHTTLAKAKELRPYSEKLITKAKRALNREQQGLPDGNEIDVHSRRIVYKDIRKKHVLEILFDEIAPAVMDRNGGYTRIVKTGRRRGDGGETALIELVDWNTDQDASFKKEKFNNSSAKSNTQTGSVIAEEVAPTEVTEETSNEIQEESEVVPSEEVATEVSEEVVTHDTTDGEEETEDSVDDVSEDDVADEQPSEDSSANETDEDVDSEKEES